MEKGKEGAIIVEGEEQVGVRPQRDQGCQGCRMAVGVNSLQVSFHCSFRRRESSIWPVLNVSHMAGKKP